MNTGSWMFSILLVAGGDSPEVTLVRDSIERAFAVLRDPAFSGAERRDERHRRLRTIADEAFDWRAMAKSSLGVHWRKLDDRRRQRFTELFEEILAQYYLAQIDRFAGQEKIELAGSSPSAGGVEVKMRLITQSGERVPIHFFVDREQKIFDVSIEGVSIANHYRGTFDRFLINKSFDELLDTFEQKVRNQAVFSERP